MRKHKFLSHKCIFLLSGAIAIIVVWLCFTIGIWISRVQLMDVEKSHPTLLNTFTLEWNFLKTLLKHIY